MFEKRVQKYFLYADDDLDDAHIMLEFMQNIGSDLKVIVHKNGAEVIDFLLSLKSHEVLPCFILLDINMPQMNGFATLKTLKSNKQFRTIPVIMYSTSSSVIDIEKSNQLGAARFCTKPFSLGDIEKMVEEFVDLCHDLPVVTKN